jgi:hypothetical protein
MDGEMRGRDLDETDIGSGMGGIVCAQCTL